MIEEKKPGNDDSGEILADATSGEYKYGFVTDIDTDIVPPGLSEDVIRLISEKKANRNGCSNSV